MYESNAEHSRKSVLILRSEGNNGLHVKLMQLSENSVRLFDYIEPKFNEKLLSFLNLGKADSIPTFPRNKS